MAKDSHHGDLESLPRSETGGYLSRPLIFVTTSQLWQPQVRCLTVRPLLGVVPASRPRAVARTKGVSAGGQGPCPLGSAPDRRDFRLCTVVLDGAPVIPLRVSLCLLFLVECITPLSALLREALRTLFAPSQTVHRCLGVTVVSPPSACSALPVDCVCARLRLPFQAFLQRVSTRLCIRASTLPPFAPLPLRE